MGLKKEPDMVRVYRWEKAIPQYLLGHSRTLGTVESRLGDFPGLYITGNAYRGIGINDCIENSYKLSEKILSSL
jgi:oxygen-dependent protoporphyrinogen oxidase